MDVHQWNTEFATIYKDNYGDIISFFPVGDDLYGTFNRQKPGYQPVGGDYSLSYENGEWYLDWSGAKFKISITADGFDLLVGEAVTYTFSRFVE